MIRSGGFLMQAHNFGTTNNKGHASACPDFLGGGVVRWGTEQPGMKKVLLGESEVLTPVKCILQIKFVQNMDKS